MMMEYLKSDASILIMMLLLILMIILYIINAIKLKKIQSNYREFLAKLSGSKNLDENLEKLISRVENVENESYKISSYCETLNNRLLNCVQKIGVVRYTAFENVGSDLSFAVALLDDNNNGVVLNGIYSSDMSNIYAKPVKEGESSYTLSEQEKEAISKAINRILI